MHCTARVEGPEGTAGAHRGARKLSALAHHIPSWPRHSHRMPALTHPAKLRGTSGALLASSLDQYRYGATVVYGFRGSLRPLPLARVSVLAACQMTKQNAILFTKSAKL